jgi:crotonobetaine/carnitine-CoA ligase
MYSTASLTFPQVIEHKARCATSDKPLLTFVDFDRDGRYLIERRDYPQLWRNAQKIAALLRASGVGKGDAVCLYLRNHPEFVESLIAFGMLGAVAVPVDPRITGAKLKYMLEHSESKGVITGDYGVQAVAEVRPELDGIAFAWVLADGAASQTDPGFEVLNVAALPEADAIVPAPLDLKDPMCMLFTSGSTGNPKAVVIDHKRYSATATSRAANFGITRDDTMYTGLSLTHGNAFNVSLGMCLYSEISLVISRKFTKSRLWQLLKDFECTTMNLLGGMFNTIYADKVSTECLDNHLRLIIGAGMPRQLWDAYRSRFNVEILEFYGAVEGGLMVNRPGEGPVGSIGKPAPNLLAKIVDTAGNELPSNVPGQIVFANKDGSPYEVNYHKNPDASAAKTRSGWLWMGDIGYVDDEGFFYFLYRDGGSIRKNGEFISACDIEKSLAEHPSIQDVFVFGVKSENGVAGEQDVVAAIEIAAGHEYDQAALYRYCAANLEKSHVPAYIQVFEAIPKTSAEKPLISLIQSSFSRDLGNVYRLSGAA